MDKLRKQDNDSIMAKVEDRVASSNTVEIVVNIFKAVLATTPFSGGIASLMTDYIPSSRFRRLEDFARQTAEDLRDHAEEVDAEYLRTDGFAFMFEKCFRGVAENPQKEKLEAFRGILLNSAIRQDISEEEKEYFLKMTNTLTVLHIRILKFMDEPIAYLEAAGIPPSQMRGSFSQFFPVAIPGIELDVIRSAFGDLYRFGLTNTDQSIFSTMTSGQGLELLGHRISKFGTRFIHFITSPDS
jgi:hypothetical protein